jgi:hypothetical protein
MIIKEGIGRSLMMRTTDKSIVDATIKMTFTLTGGTTREETRKIMEEREDLEACGNDPTVVTDPGPQQGQVRDGTIVDEMTGAMVKSVTEATGMSK